jgi:hypothetical protein
MLDVINIPQVTNPSIGATIEFMYPGVWGLYPKRPMQATIIDVEDTGNCYKLLIKSPELNLPRWIREGEILSYVWQAPVQFPGGLTDEHAARLNWFNANGFERIAAASYTYHHAIIGMVEVCGD